MPERSVTYALIFTFKELITSNRFLSSVTGSGRALMVREGDEGWWLYGVEPGGLAASGDTPQEAHRKFTDALKGILLDLADESASFADFDRRVQAFFHEVDETETGNWTRAIEALRSGELRLEDPFSALPRQPAESPRFVVVQEIERKLFPPVESRNDFALPAAA